MAKRVETCATMGECRDAPWACGDSIYCWPYRSRLGLGLYRRAWVRSALHGVLMLASGSHVYAVPQSMLDPAGPHAARIAELWWSMLTVAVLVVLAVVVLLLIAAFRGRGTPHALDAGRSRALVLGGGVILPVVVTIPFVASSFSLSALMAGPSPPGALTVEIVSRM